MLLLLFHYLDVFTRSKFKDLLDEFFWLTNVLGHDPNDKGLQTWLMERTTQLMTSYTGTWLSYMANTFQKWLTVSWTRVETECTFIIWLIFRTLRLYKHRNQDTDKLLQRLAKHFLISSTLRQYHQRPRDLKLLKHERKVSPSPLQASAQCCRLKS